MASVIEAELADFIEATRRRRWGYGQDDCTMFPANWLLLRRGFDVAALWRGTYSTAHECRALLDSHGGLLPLVSTAMARHGFQETAEPVTGDVGIVEAMAQTPDGVTLRQIGAIRQGSMWVCRGIRPPIVAARIPLVMAWSIHAPR